MDMDPRYYNKDPFPIKRLVQTVPVDYSDPRIGLRGGKKVVATDEIKANQIIGMYEGCYYFECEHNLDRNILNEMEKQYKAIDVNLLDSRGSQTETVRVKEKNFVKSGVRVEAHLGRDGYRQFSSNMLIDANNSVGPFSVFKSYLILQWSAECNDFRQDPLKSVEEMYKNKKDIDQGKSANCKWIYVWILV
jgi:hypothetical protein